MKTLVLFGDSITAGYGREAITPILQEGITAKLAMQRCEPLRIINAGMPGDTTVDGLKRLEQEVLSERPDLVTLFFGANDTNSDRLVPLVEYQKNLEEMIQSIGKEKIILLTPPYVDCQRKPTREEQRMQRYVKQVMEIGEQQGIPVINVYQAMVSAPDPHVFLQADGLHFSKDGYDLLAALIVEAIKGRLKTNVK